MTSRQSPKNLAVMVAVAKNGVIGKNNTLPWRLPSDLQWFKKTTMGQAIIMGRKTYQSIGKPLPGRQNIVLSRSELEVGDGVVVCQTLEQAIEVATTDTVFVIGGAQVYRLAMSKAALFYLTMVNAEVDGDTWFPFVDMQDWQLVSNDPHQADEHNQYDCEFRCYQRKVTA